MSIREGSTVQNIYDDQNRISENSKELEENSCRENKVKTVGIGQASESNEYEFNDDKNTGSLLPKTITVKAKNDHT